jgi:predicted phosphodiesterase
VPQGGRCAFCALPDQVIKGAVARWKGGQGTPSVSDWVRQQGHQQITQAMVANCLSRGRHHGERDGTNDALTSARLGKIADLLDRSGIAPADIGKVKAVRLSEWQGLTKNDEGEAEVHNLTGASILLTPAWDDGPKWPVINQAKPCVVGAPATKTKKRKGKWKRAVVLPDVQVGFRRLGDDAALDPFHDETAMSAALRVVQAVDPDLVVLLGDYLDFPTFSKYEQEASFALTTQHSIDRAHRYLVEIQAAAPQARLALLEGNHDRRLQASTVRNNLASFGLRRANAPDEWPVQSVPYLLRLEELGVEYVAGYPANIFWFSDSLAAIHGHKVRSSGSTAAAVVDDERVSIIFGHIHRIEAQYKTRRTRSGPKTSFAASPGCLCRIDGAVPSTKGSTDPLGRPIATAENWQTGCAVVGFTEGDGPFTYEQVFINDGLAHFRGELL